MSFGLRFAVWTATYETVLSWLRSGYCPVRNNVDICFWALTDFSLCLGNSTNIFFSYCIKIIIATKIDWESADLTPPDINGQTASEKARDIITALKTNSGSGNGSLYFWVSDTVWVLSSKSAFGKTENRGKRTENWWQCYLCSKETSYEKDLIFALIFHDSYGRLSSHNWCWIWHKNNWS